MADPKKAEETVAELIQSRFGITPAADEDTPSDESDVATWTTTVVRRMQPTGAPVTLPCEPFPARAFRYEAARAASPI